MRRLVLGLSLDRQQAFHFLGTDLFFDIVAPLVVSTRSSDVQKAMFVVPYAADRQSASCQSLLH